jgi:hypothetical protein
MRRIVHYRQILNHAAFGGAVEGEILQIFWSGEGSR